MTVYYVLLTVVFLELVWMTVLLCALLLKRLIMHFKIQWSIQRRQELVDLLIQALGSNMVSDVFSCYKKRLCKRMLLSILEDFNRKLKGDYWTDVKNYLLSKHLRPQALKWMNSPFWTRRCFAARCLALAPHQEDEEAILRLLEDPVILVRGFATSAALVLESYPALIKIIRQMSQVQGYERCFYKDLLLQGSIKLFAWMIRIAMKEQNRELHEVALEFLAEKITAIPCSFLQEDLQSKSPTIRRLALKACMNNPHHASFSLAVKSLRDPAEGVRLEALRSLARFDAEEVFALLKAHLEDPSRPIQLEAAYTLKRMGQEGIDLLKQQEVKGSQGSCALAQYVLRFD